MPTKEIAIKVDAKAAKFYTAATEQDQRKIDALLDLRLQEVAGSTRSLEEIMQEMSRNSKARGLTPEILDSLLAEDE